MRCFDSGQEENKVEIMKENEIPLFEKILAREHQPRVIRKFTIIDNNGANDMNRGRYSVPHIGDDNDALWAKTTITMLRSWQSNKD